MSSFLIVLNAAYFENKQNKQIKQVFLLNFYLDT